MTESDISLHAAVVKYIVQVQLQVYLFPSLYTKCKNSQVKYI